jgi:hypothetical protein
MFYIMKPGVIRFSMFKITKERAVGGGGEGQLSSLVVSFLPESISHLFLEN